MRILGLVFLLLCAPSVLAQSALLGKRLISVGDESARVRELGGEPEKLDKIPADESTPAMEIWTYQRKGRQITLWVVNGKIVQLEDKKMDAK